MENALAAGLSRQLALTRALDATANNIANQTTPGFKSERVLFAEYLARVSGDSGDPFVSLVHDVDSFTDFAPGGMEATYGDLDFAIEGDGFFAVETDAGRFYTRDGRFAVNEFGELTTRSGARVLDGTAAPILIDPDGGPLLLSNDGALQQRGATIGLIGVYRFEDPRTLSRHGENLFASTETPTPTSAPRVRQGFLETSNVGAIAAMTDMISIMRAYEQTARLIESADDLARRAVQSLARQA